MAQCAALNHSCATLAWFHHGTIDVRTVPVHRILFVTGMHYTGITLFFFLIAMLSFYLICAKEASLHRASHHAVHIVIAVFRVDRWLRTKKETDGRIASCLELVVCIIAKYVNMCV